MYAASAQVTDGCHRQRKLKRYNVAADTRL